MSSAAYDAERFWNVQAQLRDGSSAFLDRPERDTRAIYNEGALQRVPALPRAVDVPESRFDADTLARMLYNPARTPFTRPASGPLAHYVPPMTLEPAEAALAAEGVRRNLDHGLPRDAQTDFATPEEHEAVLASSAALFLRPDLHRGDLSGHRWDDLPESNAAYNLQMRRDTYIREQAKADAWRAALSS